jgi:hypothetical protein
MPIGPTSTGRMLDYAAFPRIDREALRMLWIHDYWDGPLSGMIVHDGKLRWFECCDLNPETRDVGARRFVVRDLAEEQIAEEERWHALFVEHVGDHWTVHGDGRRGTVKPPEEHAKFYEPYSKRSPPDYSTRPILGWFEL